MKLLLAALCLALVSCGSRAYYPNGLPAHADYTNFTGTTEIRSKGFYYRRSGTQDAATPTRAAIDSIGNTAVKFGVGGAGMMIPMR